MRWFPTLTMPMLLGVLAMTQPVHSSDTKNLSDRPLRDIAEDFFVSLPKEKRPIPEPLPQGGQPGFALRGTKGWLWNPEQYLQEIPVLAEYKMNFLMNCYGSLCDIEHYPWGDPRCNRWWEPLPDGKRKAYEGIVRECQKRNIQFCFSMNPNLTSERPLDYSSPNDLDQLWQHYGWMQSLGVKWFNISLDDISKGIDASGQARAVNETFRRLRKNDPEAQFIFTPTHYWGNGENDPYLATLAKELDPDVYIFWTGDSVVGVITRAAAGSYKKAVGHRLFLWDNYPVNDAKPTLHLGPLVHRDPDLCEVVDGYMSNPLHSQNQINRLPLITCADYAFNPRAYDAGRSIGQAILHLSDTPAQRQVLKDLVELYPGFVICGHADTGWNPVRVRFREIIQTPNSRYLGDLYLRHVGDVAERMGNEFPDRFESARRTVLDDVEAMKKDYTGRYGD